MREDIEEKENLKLNIKLDNFEGPLDLLCFLIDKKKMDITEINISEIAKEYLEIISDYEKFNLEISSEFIQMASKLVYIKSKEVLPKHKEDIDEIDEEEELINRIIEYKKYKENLPSFKNAYEENKGRVIKPGENIELPKKEFNENLHITLIANSYNNTYQNFFKRKNENSKNIKKLAVKERFSVRKKIKDILNFLMKKKKMNFNKTFNEGQKPKGEVIAAFLGVLELGKKEEVKIKQKENFKDILVEKTSTKKE